MTGITKLSDSPVQQSLLNAKIKQGESRVIVYLDTGMELKSVSIDPDHLTT